MCSICLCGEFETHLLPGFRILPVCGKYYHDRNAINKKGDFSNENWGCVHITKAKRQKKSLRRIEGNIYMDGLVSTGNKISYHNIKYIFGDTKNIL